MNRYFGFQNSPQVGIFVMSGLNESYVRFFCSSFGSNPLLKLSQNRLSGLPISSYFVTFFNGFFSIMVFSFSLSESTLTDPSGDV